MKKYSLLLAVLAAALFASCKKDGTTDSRPVITLSSPAAAASFDLENGEDVVFAWAVSGGSFDAYQLVLSKSDQLAEPQIVEIPVVAALAKQAAISASQLDARVAALGFSGGAEANLYWSIAPGSATQQAQTETRAITLKRRNVGPALQLVSPETPVLLDKDTPDAVVNLQWNAAPGATGYEIVFSSRDYLADPVTVAGIPGSATGKAFTHRELQALLFDDAPAHNLKRYKENTVYWNVKIDGKLSDREPASFRMSGMRIFTDVRGDESITYDVSVLSYNDTETVWLANDLRAANDRDGNPLDESYYIPLPAAVIAQYPQLQEPTVGKYYSAYRQDLKEMIVPEGWKLPTHNDYCDLYIAASYVSQRYADSYLINWAEQWDCEVLKDPDYYPAAEHSNFNRWNMNFRPNGRFQYNADGFEMSVTVINYVYDNSPDPHGDWTNKSGYGFCHVFYHHMGQFGDGEGAIAPVRLIYTGDDE
ncbi:MAG: fibrobacter succinogenes major paralogous domain-containing protein [Bacteroidales bacterium]|jgi:hypothetical protein|nr:fibrobacter succinogenes major paralogous domain-containing protein [Bacteroidales bacterium]